MNPESSSFCVGNNFLEKGVLELGIDGWVGEYLSDWEKAFQAGGIASAEVLAQRLASLKDSIQSRVH